MNDAATKYWRLMQELLWRRESGPLDILDEARYASELDELWHIMSEPEHAEIERRLQASRIVQAPSSLARIDVQVSPPTHKAPRRAAA